MTRRSHRCFLTLGLAMCAATLGLLRLRGRGAGAPADRSSTQLDSSAPWPQYGGPSRDFRAADAHAPLDWPEGGPTILWRRPFGDGFSGIVADDIRLYTMARMGDEEVVVALDPDSGRTIWEHRYPAPIDASAHPSG